MRVSGDRLQLRTAQIPVLCLHRALSVWNISPGVVLLVDGSNVCNYQDKSLVGRVEGEEAEPQDLAPTGTYCLMGLWWGLEEEKKPARVHVSSSRSPGSAPSHFDQVQQSTTCC